MKIGVFDSGIGGLTIFFEYIKKFRGNEYLYFADQKNAPFGEKTPSELLKITNKAYKYFSCWGADLTVFACNTASLYTKKNVLETIKPTSKNAIFLSDNKKIAVLATVATVNSHVYKKTLMNYGANKVKEIACPKLVPLIEAQMPTENALIEYMNIVNKTDVDTVVLGCTHFAIIKNKIEKLTDKKVVDSTVPMVKELEKYVDLNVEQKTFVKYETSGNKMFFEKQIRWLKNE
jgi:glutamate racemase